ncbi:MAG: cupin domain-containing protein [Candidatus Dormibacteraceae bacterium]|nr:cupin domain-containing protein [Candidatus Acidoferrales bacterium]
MSFHRFDDLPKEVVTPKHSMAFGELLTGEKIELGRLHFNTGEGANPHQHPQEQIMFIVKGALEVTLDGETAVLRPGEAFHATPMVLHNVTAKEDTDVLSFKSLVDGAGHRI